MSVKRGWSLLTWDGLQGDTNPSPRAGCYFGLPLTRQRGIWAHPGLSRRLPGAAPLAPLPQGRGAVPNPVPCLACNGFYRFDPLPKPKAPIHHSFSASVFDYCSELHIRLLSQFAFFSVALKGAWLRAVVGVTRVTVLPRGCLC